MTELQVKYFQYLSALFRLIADKHYPTYFSQIFVQLMGRTSLHGLDIGMDGTGAGVFLAQIICHALTQWCHKKKKV
jgi:hypothetical protein